MLENGSLFYKNYLNKVDFLKNGSFTLSDKKTQTKYKIWLQVLQSMPPLFWLLYFIKHKQYIF